MFPLFIYVVISCIRIVIGILIVIVVVLVGSVLVVLVVNVVKGQGSADLPFLLWPTII